jgi:type VI secretion system protein VasG
MITDNFKQLLEKLNRYCLLQLDAAAGYSMSRGHYEIGIEHLFLKFVEDGKGDIPVLLQFLKKDTSALLKPLLSALDAYRVGNTGKPGFSKHLFDLIEQAWLLASVEFNQPTIRSSHLFLALCRPSAGHMPPVTEKEWPFIRKEEVTTAIFDGIADSVEEIVKKEMDDGQSPESKEALEQFTENLTEKARQGKIDPVFSRDDEIRQMIDILSRRRKNNPILVGEPGTGKTAIVEGLALKIIQSTEVPPAFQDADLLSLDLGLLQAGASVKGEFENRLKTVIEAISNYNKPVITFIDEAHTLIGAGNVAGSTDAANLLKPALARGELRTVAATTWKEYKSYFEKDPALARRFQLVKVEEPDDEGTAAIVRGLKPRYEMHHGVHITDEAVNAAVKLSRRYISGRQLPDKAIDLMDTAAARVLLSQHSTPASITHLTQTIAALEREKKALQRDRLISESTGAIETKIERIDSELEALSEEHRQKTDHWNQEKELVSNFLQASAAMENEVGLSANTSPTDLQENVYKIAGELKSFQNQSPMVFSTVDEEVIASIVADWTGIPVGRMIGDEASKLLNLDERIAERIIGQDTALQTISELLRMAKSGLQDPTKPLGVFLLAGPSGVGKTETAITIADLLFGGENYMVTVNMSEFQEKHTVSRLIGSPPGYVGYGEGGVLTEAIRQKPYSVVLLDEVEKAHPDVMELFFQVFDKGTLADGEGRVINCSNTVIILTTNLGYEIVNRLADDASTDGKMTSETVAEAIRPTLSSHFSPAFLARTTIIPYFPLPQETIAKIVQLKLNSLDERIRSMGATICFDDDVIEWIASRCNVSESGARNVEHVLNTQISPKLSIELLSSLDEPATLAGREIHIGVQQGQIRITFG